MLSLCGCANAATRVEKHEKQPRTWASNHVCLQPVLLNKDHQFFLEKQQQHGSTYLSTSFAYFAQCLAPPKTSPTKTWLFSAWWSTAHPPSRPQNGGAMPKSGHGTPTGRRLRNRSESDLRGKLGRRKRPKMAKVAFEMATFFFWGLFLSKHLMTSDASLCCQMMILVFYCWHVVLNRHFVKRILDRGTPQRRTQTWQMTPKAPRMFIASMGLCLDIETNFKHAAYACLCNYLQVDMRMIWYNDYDYFNYFI